MAIAEVYHPRLRLRGAAPTPIITASNGIAAAVRIPCARSSVGSLAELSSREWVYGIGASTWGGLR